MTTYPGHADQLSEAAAPENFLERIKALDQGEMARLAGGVAVKRIATEDGRDAWLVSNAPYAPRSDPDFYGPGHRTADKAAAEAFDRSARSSDPDSIGGETRIDRYIDYVAPGGDIVRLRGFTPLGLAIVSADSLGAKPIEISVSNLSKKTAVKASWLSAGMVQEADLRNATPEEVISEAERALMAETYALLEADNLLCEEDAGWLSEELAESAKTAGYSVKHAPIGKGGKNWITADKPGNTGQMPAYIQNVRNAIVRSGKTVSKATGIAIGRIKKWAAGIGNVSPEVKAAAAKALAEWEAMKARAKAKRGGKPSGKLSEAFWVGEG